MTERLRALRINVSGRVQGVGFRYSTQRFAARIGLTGWVRNERDGTVEIHCEGEPEKIAELLDWLERGGPSSSSISSINQHPANPQGIYSRFSIDY